LQSPSELEGPDQDGETGHGAARPAEQSHAIAAQQPIRQNREREEKRDREEEDDDLRDAERRDRSDPSERRRDRGKEELAVEPLDQLRLPLRDPGEKEAEREEDRPSQEAPADGAGRLRPRNPVSIVPRSTGSARSIPARYFGRIRFGQRPAFRASASASGIHSRSCRTRFSGFGCVLRNSGGAPPPDCAFIRSQKRGASCGS